MMSFFESLDKFFASYSGAFLLFWGAVLLSCVVLSVVESRKGQEFVRVESHLYWAFGVAMVLFAALRPIGIARDDLGYLQIFKEVCPITMCEHWIHRGRDSAWYTLVGFLKVFSETPRVILVLSAVGLLVKLVVIYKLSHRPLPVLLLYLSIFYQVQDLTALRVSLAITVFLVAIASLARVSMLKGILILVASGFFHKQGFVALLVLIGRLFKGRPMLFTCCCGLPLIALFLGMTLDVPHLLLVTYDSVRDIMVTSGLAGHIVIDNNDIAFGRRNAPIVVYPLVIFMLFMMWPQLYSDDRLSWLLAGCLFMGCLFLWSFAWRTDAQVRFFEFFMVPTVLLVGTARLNLFQLAGLILVSGIFVAKYNMISHLLTGYLFT